MPMKSQWVIAKRLPLSPHGPGRSDIGVELSHNTKEVTHRIAPAVDDERDLMITALTTANRVFGTRWIEGFQKTLQGRNGGGDPWHSDGRLPVVTLAPSPPLK